MAVWAALLLAVLLLSHHSGDTGEPPLPPWVALGVVGAVRLSGLGVGDAGGTWQEMHCPGRVLGFCVSRGRVPSSNPGSQRQPELPLPQEHASLHPSREVQQHRGVARGEQLPAPRGGVSAPRAVCPACPP